MPQVANAAVKFGGAAAEVPTMSDVMPADRRHRPVAAGSGSVASVGALASVTGHVAVAVGAVLPFHMYWALSPGAGPVDGPLLSLQDVVLFALVALGIPGVMIGRSVRATTRERLGAVTRWLLVLWAAVALAGIAAPSSRGALHLLRMLGLVVMVEVLRDRGVRRRVGDAVVIATVCEALVMLAQRWTGRPIGLGALESPSPFLQLVPGYPTPLGTTGHPYHAGFICALGAMLAVTSALAPGASARRRRSSLVAVALLSLAAGQSSGRMLVVIVVALGAGTLVVTFRDRSLRRRGLAAAAVITLPAMIWVATTSTAYTRPQTTGMSQAESLASGRGGLASRAIDIWSSAPVLGVGPGNHVAAERALGLPQIGPWPIVVHNFGLQVLAETGVVGAGALAVTAGGIVVSLRRRWRSLVLPAALLVPSALLDHVLWTYGFAMIVMAIALGSAQPPLEARGDDGAAVPEGAVGTSR